MLLCHNLARQSNEKPGFHSERITVRLRKLPADFVVWLIIGMALPRDRSIGEVLREIEAVGLRILQVQEDYLIGRIPMTSLVRLAEIARVKLVTVREGYVLDKRSERGKQTGAANHEAWSAVDV